MVLGLFDIDNWREVFAALGKNKLRTVLTAFGVFWGIFMLIILLGTGIGLERGVTKDFGEFAKNSMFLWTRPTTIAYKGFPRGRRFAFTNDDIPALRDNIPEIDLLAPEIQGWGAEGENNAIRGDKTGSFGIDGHFPEFIVINPLTLVQGRFINENDVAEKRKVAVIGTRVYELLFEPGENAIGEYIKLQGVYFQVVGIFKPKTMHQHNENELEKIILPFTTLQKVYNYGEEFRVFILTAKPDIPVSEVEKKVKKLLAQRHSVSPDDERAFGGFNMEEEFNKIQKLFFSIQGLMWIVGTGTLLSGVIGVSNIMLVIVRERTKEFGIKRAIGATPWSIISHIIMESVFLTSITGFVGMVLGIWLLEGVSVALLKVDSGMFRNPGVDIGIAIKALIILIVSGTLAGLIPAKRAISIKPIDAIRN